MKKILLLATLLLGASFLATAQEEEDWSIPVKFNGQRPVITDFVSAFLAPDDLGESLGGASDDWKDYQKGRPLPKDRSFTVDVKNGYVRYDAEYHYEESPVYSKCIEFCYWNHSDGIHKVVAQNTTDFQEGKPFMGQYSGVTFFLYDGKTKKMDVVYAGDLGIEIDFPDNTEVVVYNLPRTGKTLECVLYTSTGKVTQRFTWDGSKFVNDSL